MTKQKRKNTGVGEWAEKSVNIQYGCENNCRYCYARKMAARFNRIPDKGWEYPIIKSEIFFHLPQNTTVMLPSTHDITEHNVGDMLVLMGRLLKRNNRLLIVSKPRKACIKLLYKNEVLLQYRDKIEFRFTIGSIYDDILKQWEPNAPDAQQRISCLDIIAMSGFTYSISCEPLLERDHDNGHVDVIDYLLQSFAFKPLTNYVTTVKEIWIGAMNYMKDAPKLDYTKIYAKYKDNPIIKWKDSFRKHLS
jgi:DNA repair photolyase